MTAPSAYPKEIDFDFKGVHCHFSTSGLIIRFNGNTTENFKVLLSLENDDGKVDTPLSMTDSIGRLYLHPREFHLIPGENRITIRIEDENKKVLIEKTFVIFGDGFVFKKEGVSIYVDRGELYDSIVSNQSLLGQLTNVIGLFNSFLPEKFRMRNLFVENRPQESQGILSREGFDICSGLFRESELSILTAIFHECAHFFDNQIHESKPKEWEKFYSMFVSTALQATRRFAIFDESDYIEGVPSLRGHPNDNASELFASASTVLRFFPEEFMKRVSNLRGDERMLALDVARFIVTQYLENPKCPRDFFHPDLLKFLGLAEKKKEATH